MRGIVLNQFGFCKRILKNTTFGFLKSKEIEEPLVLMHHGPYDLLDTIDITFNEARQGNPKWFADLCKLFVGDVKPKIRSSCDPFEW